jgi:hypothetical protein
VSWFGWLRRRPKPLPIPAYRAERSDAVMTRPKPEPGIVVEEVDTSAMTQTGVHRAWKRLTGDR